MAFWPYFAIFVWFSIFNSFGFIVFIKFWPQCVILITGFLIGKNKCHPNHKLAVFYCVIFTTLLETFYDKGKIPPSCLQYKDIENEYSSWGKKANKCVSSDGFELSYSFMTFWGLNYAVKRISPTFYPLQLSWILIQFHLFPLNSR